MSDVYIATTDRYDHTFSLLRWASFIGFLSLLRALYTLHSFRVVVIFAGRLLLVCFTLGL